MRSEIRRTRHGEYYFRCRRCKKREPGHFTSISALADRDRHECEEKA